MQPTAVALSSKGHSLNQPNISPRGILCQVISRLASHWLGPWMPWMPCNLIDSNWIQLFTIFTHSNYTFPGFSGKLPVFVD